MNNGIKITKGRKNDGCPDGEIDGEKKKSKRNKRERWKGRMEKGREKGRGKNEGRSAHNGIKITTRKNNDEETQTERWTGKKK